MTGSNEHSRAGSPGRFESDTSPPLFSLLLLGVLLALLGGASGCAAPVPPELEEEVASAREANDLLIVDCLLPGRVRHLGTQVTYLEARRAIKTTGRDCGMRGGEYTGYDRANYATALETWRQQAEAGDPQAQTYVAEIYEKGLGREPDYAMAAMWYQRAADQGHATAQINLGQLYELGLGVAPDRARALELYRLASGLEGEFVPAEELRAISQRQAEYEVVRRQLRERTQEAQRLRRELDELSRELEALRSRPAAGAIPPAAPAALAAKQELLAKKQAELEQLDRQIDYKSQELAMRESQLDEVERAIVERNQELERLAVLAAGLQRDQQALAQARREADAARSELVAIAAQRDEALRLRDAATAARQAEIARLEQTAEALTAGNAAIAQRQHELAALRRDIDALEKERAGQAALTAGTLAVFDEQIEAAEREQAALDRALEVRAGELAAIDHDLDGTRAAQLAEREALRSELAELERGRSQAARQGQSKLAGLAAEVTALTVSLAGKRAELERSDAALEQAEDTLAERREELRQSEAALARSRRELAEGEEALARQQRLLAQADEALADRQTSTTADQQALEARRAEVGEAEEALELRRTQLATSEQSLAVKQAEIAALDEALVGRRAEIEASDRAMADRQAEIAVRDEALAGRRAEIEASEQALTGRQAALVASDATLVERRGELAQLNLEIDQLRAERDASSSQKARQIASLEQQISLLDSRVDELAPQAEAFERRRAEAVALEGRMSELRGEVAVLEGQVREHEAAPVIEVAGPVIEMIEPRVSRTRGVHLVRTIVLDAKRVVVGRVTAPAGLLSVMVNETETQVASNGIFRAEIGIGQGDAPVEVVAVDNQGKRDSLAFTLSPQDGPAAVSSAPPLTRGIEFGNYYALVIGNNNYANLPNLVTAQNDAKAVSRLLEERYGFRVTTIYDADRAKILRSLNALRMKLTEDDNLLVYYAGHGELDRVNQRGNWLPIDAEPDDTTNWISNITLTDILHNMTAKHVMVIADSCYSGALLTRSTLTAIRGGLTRSARFDVIRQGASKRSRTALTSGAIAPVLDGGTKTNNSVFAGALLDVLRENEEVLDGQGLHRSVAALVARASAARGFEQAPQYEAIKGDGHEIGGEFFFVPGGAMGRSHLDTPRQASMAGR